MRTLGDLLRLRPNRLLFGRQRFQPAFRSLHRLALAGLNYGDDNPACNGEYALIDRLADEWPPTPVVFDVGAFHGEWTREVLRRAPAATVHAFEPVPASLKHLQCAIPMGAELHPLALGAEDGEVQMTGPLDFLGMASVVKRDLSSVGLATSPVATATMTRLDTFCNAHAIDRIDLLKIDTEGHELAVLKGAEGMLETSAIKAVQFEFGGTDIDSRVFLRDFLRLLSPNYTLYRVLRDGLAPVEDHGREEIFTYANFAALRS